MWTKNVKVFPVLCFECGFFFFLVLPLKQWNNPLKRHYKNCIYRCINWIKTLRIRHYVVVCFLLYSLSVYKYGAAGGDYVRDHLNFEFKFLWQFKWCKLDLTKKRSIPGSWNLLTPYHHQSYNLFLQITVKMVYSKCLQIVMI